MKNPSKNDQVFSYVEKTLNLLCGHIDTYNARSSRPYYPLNDGWGLTFLSSGQPFFVNTVDRNITPWLIMGGHWETNVDRVLMEYTKPGMRVIDIGANMGYYTVKLGTRIGRTGRLWAFEPNPAVSDHCLENIKINGLGDTVILHNIALGDIKGTATLTSSKSNMASANLVGDQDADFSTEVRVDTLDAILNCNEAIDLIKLDAEGYEPRILMGSKEVISRSPDCAIMIELSLDRWERTAPIDHVLPLCGGAEAELFAVTNEGSLNPIEVKGIRAFLSNCAFKENYFLVGRRGIVEKNCGGLITPAAA